MIKTDAEEAAVIAQTVLAAILSVTATQGRTGADLRSAIGDFNANALPLIQYDQSGPPLAAIFDLARKAGVSQAQLASVRIIAAGETPKTLGAILMRDSLINFSLATEGRILADTTFASREAVDAMREQMNAAFDPMIEIAADDMDSLTYQALIGLLAGITEHLIAAGRPLPVMLNFQFAAPGPTLVFAYRLYDDAGRADELREENHVVHPAFARPFGRALSE
jgi:prophage DNA circulation protein